MFIISLNTYIDLMPLATIILQGPEKENISKVVIGSNTWFVQVGGDYLPPQEVEAGELAIKIYGTGGYDIYQKEQTRVLPNYPVEIIISAYSYDFDVEVR